MPIIHIEGGTSVSVKGEIGIKREYVGATPKIYPVVGDRVALGKLTRLVGSTILFIEADGNGVVRERATDTVYSTGAKNVHGKYYKPIDGETFILGDPELK